MVAVCQAVADFDLIHFAGKQRTCLQIHQFTDDVGPRQINIIFTLTVAQVGI